MKSSLFIFRLTPVWLVLCLCLSLTVACQKPPIKINLISDKTSYAPKEPIQMQIRVYNDKTNIFGVKRPVIARKGFFYQDFHLLLTIIDPKGSVVAKKFSGSAIEPLPPYQEGNRFLIPVEIIPPGDENIYFMNDTGKYYLLGETFGWYTAVVHTSLETFSRYKEYPTGKLYGELFAFCNQNFDPLTSNKIRFEIAPEEPPIQSTIRAHVNSDVSAAGDKKTALENANVRLYLVSRIPKKYQPFNRNLFRAVWNNVRSQKSTLTDSKGVAVFSWVEQDDYLVLARHAAFAGVVIAGDLIAKSDVQWQAGNVVEFYLSYAP